MIDNKQLVDAYLHRHGLRRTKGEDESFAPLLPFLMLDAMLNLYEKDIKKIPCSQMMRHQRNLWTNNYSLFNRDFFSCFNQEQKDAIIDKMDEYESYLEHHIFIAKIQIMECINFLPMDKQNGVASCLLCNILAQSAQIVWRDIYKNGRMQGKENPYIRNIQKWSYEFMNTYYGGELPNVNCNESKGVRDAVTILCNKMVEFLKR